MDRLTMESPNGGVALTFDLDLTCKKSEIMKLLKVFKKLKEYEDLEEQGLLLKLPCKVGDTLYFVKGKNHAEIEELEVMKFVYSNELDIMFSDEFYEVGLVSIKEIGKTVFLTEEAANIALEEQNNVK